MKRFPRLGALALMVVLMVVVALPVAFAQPQGGRGGQAGGRGGFGNMTQEQRDAIRAEFEKIQALPEAEQAAARDAMRAKMQEIMGGAAGGNRPATGTRDGGGFDMVTMRANQAKTALKCTDDEWAVLEELVKDVIVKQQAASTRGGFGGRGGAPRGGADTAAEQTDMQKAQAAVRTASEDAAATPAQIKASLVALRALKAKKEADVKAAQAKLAAVLTLRQEAVLLVMGLVD